MFAIIASRGTGQVRATQQVNGFNPEGPEDDCETVHATYGRVEEGEGAMLVVVEPKGKLFTSKEPNSSQRDTSVLLYT